MEKDLKTHTNRGFLTTEDEVFLNEGRRLGRQGKKLLENTGFGKENVQRSIRSD
jgi:hypothetical protein